MAPSSAGERGHRERLRGRPRGAGRRDRHPVIGAGAVGINIEDAHRTVPPPLRPAGRTGQRIAAARAAADLGGVHLYINARIDTYLRAVGEEETRLQETLDRAAAYLAAGADGVFVPGTTDPGGCRLTDGHRRAGQHPGRPRRTLRRRTRRARRRTGQPGSSVAAAAYQVVRHDTRSS